MKEEFFYIVTILLLILSACNNQNISKSISTISGPTMGTVYTIQISDPKASMSQERLRTEVNRCLFNINQVMSTYLRDSELSKINQTDSVKWLQVSNDLWLVLREAERISVISDGAFDVTIGPLVNLWGFGPKVVEKDMLPNEDDITEKMQITGYKKIEYHINEKKIRKQVTDLYIDLSAIAKGYAVDRVAQLLDEYGYENYMVDIGGEVVTKGSHSKERGWRVGIEKPVFNSRSIHEVVELEDMGMATSGDYRNYFEVDGKYYSHTINPKTGMPVEHKLASVSVLHKSVMRADALATALNVLGPEKGFELAEREGIVAYFIVYDGKQYKEMSTHGFEKYIVNSVTE